jgi:type I restriction enzyme S subunit
LAKSSITSSGVPNLNVKSVREFPVYYPSLNDQIVIITEIEKFESAYLELVMKYEQKVQSIEELKKSILQKAFAGELTQKEVLA